MADIFGVLFEPEVFWEEFFKFLFNFAGLLLAGWVAHKLQWIGVQRWDSTKYAYEIFSAEQSRRLQLLMEMYEISTDICERLRRLCSDEARLMKMVREKIPIPLGNNTQARIAAEREAISAAQEELRRLARRYGATPSTKERASVPLCDLVEVWKREFESLTQPLVIGDHSQHTRIFHYGSKMVSTVQTLRNEEESILVETRPQDIKQLMRSRHHVNTNTLL